MKRPMGYTKGGGADTGTLGERKSKLGVSLQKVRRYMKKNKDTEIKRICKFIYSYVFF